MTEEIVERELTIKIKGTLKEINTFCKELGEIMNKYDTEFEY